MVKNLFFASLFFSVSISAQSDLLYGLNFTTGELRFASIEISSGEVDILSSAAISPDAFQPGVSDFNPFEKEYYYIRGSGGQAEIITVDALSGTVVQSPNLLNSNDAVIPITNIAYNWLNDTIYGLNHVYSNSTELKLSSVNPETGAVEIISQSPIYLNGYLAGNSDIDPVHRKYFFVTPQKIYTIDLNDGSVLYSPNLGYPAGVSGEYMVNMTYNWIDGEIYALYFAPSANPIGYYTSELKLAKIDSESGAIEILSNTALSPDGFSASDCDIDPVGNRFFYVRQNDLYEVDLSDGELISITNISNPNNAIAPITSIAYDDFYIPPVNSLPMNMGGQLFLDPGESLTLNAYVGDELTYEWGSGESASNIEINQPGNYWVKITKEDVEIFGEVEVVENVINSLDDNNDDLFNLYPNPSSDVLFIESKRRIDRIEVYGLLGNRHTTIDPLDFNVEMKLNELNSGTYFIKIYADGISQTRILLVD